MASRALTAWLVSLTALLLGLVGGQKVTRLAMQVGNDIRSYGGQTEPVDMARFLGCVCGKRVFDKSCGVPFTDIHLTLNIARYRFRPPSASECSEVRESKDRKDVTINYARPNLGCTSSPHAVYVDIQCPSGCLALLRYDTLSEGSHTSKEVFRKNETCNTPCCRKVFDPEFGKESGNASKATTPGEETSSTLLPYLKELETSAQTTTSLTVSTTSSKTSSSLSLSPELNSTTRLTADASSGIDRRDVILLIACIVTATLALAAIVISAVACRRHSSRSKRSAATELVGPGGGESTCAAPQGNVYSALNPVYSGSTRKYAGFSPCARDYEKVGGCGAHNIVVDNAAHQDEERMSAIYDNIADVECEYLQPIVANTKI